MHIIRTAFTGVRRLKLITLLQARGVALAAAVSFGALMDPSQVGSRVIEMMFGKRYHPGWTLVAAAALI